MSPFQPGAEKAPEPKAPAGLAGKVGHTARQRPPDPKGKGLALALIAGAAVIAAIYQISTGTGAAKQVREQRAKDAREAGEHGTDLVAPRDPRGEDPSAPLDVDAPVTVSGRAPTLEDLTEVEDAPRMPGADIPMPDGLGERTAGRLRLSLNALTSGGIVAESGIRELPRILADAGPDERDAVRGVVVDSLAALVGTRRLGGTALDAALGLASAGEEGLGPITAAVLARGLKEDRDAAAALVYLESTPPGEHAAAVEAVGRLVRDAGRPLYLRVLAARTLVGWDAVDDSLEGLASDPATPGALRKALTSP